MMESSWQEQQTSGAGAAASGWGWNDQIQDEKTNTTHDRFASYYDDSSQSMMDETAKADKHESDPSSASVSGMGGWNLTLHPSLTKKFKPPTRVIKEPITDSGTSPNTLRKINASTATTIDEESSETHEIKTMTRVGRSATTSTAASLLHPSAATTTNSTNLKPIRFVKSKEVLNADPTTSASTVDVVTGADAPPSIHKSMGLKGSILLQPSKSIQPTTSSSKYSLLSQSLLLTRKPSVAPGSISTAASTSTSTSRLTSKSHSTYTLDRIFKTTYSIAAHKKKQHREGYLHIFKSNLNESTALNSMTTMAASSSNATASSSTTTTAPSYLKSQLYSERGQLVDEQVGRSVMEYEEAQTRLSTQKRHRVSDGGLDWLDDDSNEDGRQRKRRRRGVSDESDEEEEDDETFTVDDQKSASDSKSSSSTRGRMLTNQFSLGEFVILGRFECELEEDINQAEYEFTIKLMTGVISHAPISKHSSKTSVTIDGAPLNSTNIGYQMLHAQGLNENGGVIGKNQAEKRTAIKDPLPLNYIRQDARPGIGFRDTIAPPNTNLSAHPHRGGFRGRGRGR